MQHSLIANFSSQYSRGLVRLRRQSRALSRNAARLSVSTAVAGSTTTFVVASAAAGLPDFGREGSSSKAQKKRRGPLEFGSPLRRCTDSLLVLNLLLFAADWACKHMLMVWGAKVNSLIAAGEVWRLLTSSFLHTNLVHLAINCASLNNIGPQTELLLGHSRFMAVYVGSALVGSTASFLMTPVPSVGASAALFGLGAALGVFYWRHRNSMGRHSELVLQQLGMTLAINVAYSCMSKRIDNWGHAGGLLGGAVLTWLLGPRLVRSRAGVIEDKPPLPLLAHKPLQGLNIKP